MKPHIRRFVAAAVTVAAVALLPATAAATVLRVGTYHGIKGQYKTIQAAVNAAHQGDWILIAPGDYKTSSSKAPSGAPQSPAGILMTRANITMRGMSRSKVIVDGTKPGYPACSNNPKAQNFGPRYQGRKAGLNGIEVWKANDVNVENLTTCNFLGGSGDTGNEVWWNGGAGGGQIHGWGFVASYLNTTSTFYHDESDAATYGLFSSDWSGGTFANDYASNFNDAGYYIGGCAQRCNQVIRNSQSEYNALGYSGTNSGGTLLFEYNKFDHNKDGFDTNSQNNSDWPSPQDGSCIKGVQPPVKGARSCWVLYKNQIYDNNDANVPAAGAASQGPVGTGVSIEGRNDTVMDNVIKNNGAWGVSYQPYPDTETPPANVVKAGKACRGGAPNFSLLGLNVACLYDDWGVQTVGNTFTNDGFFGNPTNGDMAQATFTAGHAINCYAGNRNTDGTLTSSPASVQTTNTDCGQIATAPTTNYPFVFEIICDSEAFGPGFGCSSSDHYPRLTKVVMHKLPSHLKSMKNACAGVPKNPWCAPSKRT